MIRIKTGAQGEVNHYRIDALPEGLIPNTERDNRGRPIVGHSETGHHHVLDGVLALLEAPNPPEGMRILYALLEQPTALAQDAGDAHETQVLEPGLYEFRISREYDPFADQIRRVAD